jgi:signal transduction histidine kinase
MRRLVGTLRGADPAGSTPAGSGPDLADDVRRVVDRARAAGLPARLTVDLPDPVPPELARSVLRLVQESLTNAGKHAHQVSAVDVEVSGSDGALRVRVVDDGTAGQDPVGGSGGYGLVGMRERVELLGGRFDAGPTGARGWQVLATLPVRDA